MLVVSGVKEAAASLTPLTTNMNKHRPATTYSCTRLALDWEIPVGAGWCVVCARATLTLTLTFHHPEQSLLHKLHWLDHVIRVGVFGVLRVKKEASFLTLNTPNTPTLIT